MTSTVTVGELELAYEALAVTAALDEIIIVYTADPDTPTDDALQRLANWSRADRGASPTER